MKYLKLFEEFVKQDVSQFELEEFVNKFDLTDKDEYDKTLKTKINDIIKMVKKGKSIQEISSKYSNIKQIINDAHDFYKQDLIQRSLPMGDLQSPNPEIPTVNIKWGQQ